MSAMIDIATLVTVTGIALDRIFDHFNCYHGIRQARFSCCSSCCELDIFRTPSTTHPDISPPSPSPSLKLNNNPARTTLTSPPSFPNIHRQSQYSVHTDTPDYSSEDDLIHPIPKRRSSTVGLINNLKTPPSDSNCYKTQPPPSSQETDDPPPLTFNIISPATNSPPKLQHYYPPSANSRRSSFDNMSQCASSPRLSPIPSPKSSMSPTPSPSQSHNHAN